MKSIILPIAFSLFTTLLVAQNDAPQTDNKKISFGVGVNIKQVQLSSKDSNFEISNNIGYALEGNFYFDIKPRLTLKAGLNFSSFQFNLTDYSLIFASDINPLNGIMDPKASYLKNNINWSYVGVPIELQFKIIGKQNEFYLKTGAEAMFNFYKKHEGEISESGMIREIDTNNFNPPNKVLGLVTFGVGMDFYLNEKNRLYIEPNIEFGINDVFENQNPTILASEQKSRLKVFGCKVGVRF